MVILLLVSDGDESCSRPYQGVVTVSESEFAKSSIKKSVQNVIKHTSNHFGGVNFF